MSRHTPQNRSVKNPRPRRIAVPKDFPSRWKRTTESTAKPSFWARISAPAGAAALHVILLALLFHFNLMPEVFGQHTADEMEWTWLPETIWVDPQMNEPPPPEPALTPPPEPQPESKPEPVPSPEIQTEQSPPPEDPAPGEIPVVPPEETSTKLETIQEPEMAPTPEPPPMENMQSSTSSDAWTEVRTLILKSIRYPAHMRRNGMEGVVTVILKLNESGEIISAEIHPPAPSKSLCDAVLTALYRVAPFRKAGEAIRQGQIPSTAEITVRFQLKNAAL